MYHFYSRKVAKGAKPLIIFKNLAPLRDDFSNWDTADRLVMYHFYSRKVATGAKPLIIFKNLAPLRDKFSN
jgi:hypothetical protein